MRPIQVPVNPTLVSRLSIRSQADLQEQLRIKQTTERQEQHLYSPPTPAPQMEELDEELLVQKELAEVKEAEEREGREPDDPFMPMMPLSSIEDFRQGLTPRSLRPPSRPPARGRKPFKAVKTVAELKQEIRETVSPPPKGLSGMRKDETIAEAEALGISLLK